MTPLEWALLVGWVSTFIGFAVAGFVHIGRAFDRGYALGKKHGAECPVIMSDRPLTAAEVDILAEAWKRIYGRGGAS